MPDPSKMDMEAKLYFNSLPPILQEQLMQSTAELNTKEDLMRYCANALGRDASRDRKSTRLNSSHVCQSRMPSSA